MLHNFEKHPNPVPPIVITTPDNWSGIFEFWSFIGKTAETQDSAVMITTNGSNQPIMGRTS
jgi:hypothetical protein